MNGRAKFWFLAAALGTLPLIALYYRLVTFNNILAGSQPAVAGGAELAAATPPVDRPRP